METCANSYIVDSRIKELENCCENSDLFAKGSLCLLKRCLKKYSLQLKSFQCFLKYAELPNLESMLQFLKAEEVTEADSVASERDEEEVYLRFANSDLFYSEDDNDNDDDNDDDDDDDDDGMLERLCDVFYNWDHFSVYNISHTQSLLDGLDKSDSLCKLLSLICNVYEYTCILIFIGNSNIY